MTFSRQGPHFSPGSGQGSKPWRNIAAEMADEEWATMLGFRTTVTSEEPGMSNGICNHFR
jgi:hypothetical protein